MVVSAALAVVTLTGTATLPVVYVLAALGGVALVLDAPGPPDADVPDGRPERAAERRRAQLGPPQRLARHRPGDRRRRDRRGRASASASSSTRSASSRCSPRCSLMRKEELYPVEPDRTRHAARGHARGARVRLARPPAARRARRRHVRRPRRLQLQHARAAARLGHAARRRAHVRAAVGGVRARRPRRRARHRIVQAGDAVGRSRSARSASASSCSRSHRCTRHWLAGVLLVGIGASFTLFAANANALVQLAAPDHLRGRLVALYLFAFVGLAPLGALLSGWLVELGGTRLAFRRERGVGRPRRDRLCGRRAATSGAAAHSNEGVPPDGARADTRVPACDRGGTG